MDIYAFLQERLPRLSLENDFSFAEHTTIGCGGISAVAAYPSCTEEAEELLAVLLRSNIPYCFLGLGANTLAADGYFEGVTVKFSRMNHLQFVDDAVYAEAGATGGALLAFATRECITGFEPFVGIPMTIGGATVMNAGVVDRHMADIVLQVYGIENGKMQVFSPQDCHFAEKYSVFRSGIAITGVKLSSERGNSEQITENLKFYKERRAHLPKGRSMGCTFVNPRGYSAGAMIEACGLKGYRVGNAIVSEEHANFIINEGTRSEDVAAIIEYVKAEVFRQTGILLREEICRIPFHNT